MRKLIFTTTLLLTAGCAKEALKEEEPIANTTAAQQAKPAEPVIKEIGTTSTNPEAIEHFKKGRALMENARRSEAIPDFTKATELDPSFALAHAYLGLVLPGAEGMKHLETAAGLAANLSEEERTLIELFVAERKGEEAKVDELHGKLVQAAPTDWRAHQMVGIRAARRNDLDAAIASYQKSIELSPNQGSTHNFLGYALLAQGKKEEAVAAFKKYAELTPADPNPHDSLADALLASGKLEEAEASYLKATEVEPKFWFAWDGVAATRALRGNWAGAEEAYTKGRDAAVTPLDKLIASIDIAWLRFTQNQTKEALEMLNEIEKQAQTDNAHETYAALALHRAAMFVEMGKAKEAIKLVDMGLERAEKAAVPGAGMTKIRGFALHVRAQAEAKLGNKDDLAKTLALFEEEVKKNPGNAHLASALHDVRGLSAMASGDPKAASEHFAGCMEQDALCAYHRVQVEEKAGNKAGADAIREKLVATPERDGHYIYVRSKLGTIPST